MPHVNVSVLHVHAVCPRYVLVHLLVHAACLCCVFTLHVHAVCQYCMNMLREHEHEHKNEFENERKYENQQ